MRATGPAEASAQSVDAGPLQQYLDRLPSQDDEHAQRAAQHQDAVAACMGDQGFEYVAASTSDLTERDDRDPTSVADAAEHGYGLVDELVRAGSTEPSGWPTANADYVATLSPARQADYWAALYGDGGCEARAMREVDEAQGTAWTDPAYAELVDQIGALEPEVDQSPAVVAATAQWSDCMAEDDIEAESQDDLIIALSARLSQLLAAADGHATAIPATSLAEMRAIEVATARTDEACAERVDLSGAQAEARRAIEQQFVDDHRDELEAWVATYGSSR